MDNTYPIFTAGTRLALGIFQLINWNFSLSRISEPVKCPLLGQPGSCIARSALGGWEEAPSVRGGIWGFDIMSLPGSWVTMLYVKLKVAMGPLYVLESFMLLVYTSVTWESLQCHSSSPLLEALGIEHLIFEAHLSLCMRWTSSHVCDASIQIHNTRDLENQAQVPREGR